MGKFAIPVDDDVDVLFIVAPVAVVLKLPSPCCQMVGINRKNILFIGIK
jgi:hypothetical protein